MFYPGKHTIFLLLLLVVIISLCFSGIYSHTGDDEQDIDIVTLGTVLRIEYDKSNKYFFTGTNKGHIIMWDISSGKPIRVFSQHSGDICSLKYFHIPQFLLSGGSDGSAKLWDINSNTLLVSIKGKLMIRTADLSPDLKTIITGYWRCPAIPPWFGLVNLWDAGSGKKKFAIKKPMYVVYKVRFTHNGKSILILTGKLSVWDSRARKRLRVFPEPVRPIKHFSISPDDALVVTCGDEKRVRLWDIATAQEIKYFSECQDDLRCVSFSEDGSLVAAGGYFGVSIWDVKTGTQVLHLDSSGRVIMYVGFSADSKNLFFSDCDAHATLWNLATNSEISHYKIYPWTQGEEGIATFILSVKSMFSKK